MSDEIKEEQKLAGIMIKPDSFEAGVEEYILRDIIAEGYEIVLDAEFTLDEGDVLELYPDETSIPVGRRKLIEYLSEKRVRMLALRLKTDESSAIEKLQKAKGNKLKGEGLRAKYNTIPVTEEDIANKSSQYYRFMMINNFHVFDSLELFVRFARRKGINIDNLSIKLEG